MLILARNRSLLGRESSELHEIVWSSAEHNIRATKSDVLLIFDCCNAGELERNVRSSFTSTAFEYLAATSANSTTRKPGPHSFTTALIWALNDLAVVEDGRFTAQQLLGRILVAPDFPKEQSPRLSERGPACPRKIVLAPLNNDTAGDVSDANPQDEEGIREDLSVRFVFSRRITEKMVTDLAVELRRFIIERDFKAETILWEGINFKSPIHFKDLASQFHVYKYAQKWLDRTKNKIAIASMIDPIPRLEVSGSSSPDDSPIRTPKQDKKQPEPEIGQDEGSPGMKTVAEIVVKANTASKARERTSSNTPPNTCPKKRKRGSAIGSGMDSSEGATAATTVTPQKRLRRVARR